MKAVIQRILDASVTVNGVVKGSIKSGLLVYLGVALEDTEKNADWLAEKIVHLRIFDDAEGVMNLSIKDIVNNQNADKSNYKFENHELANQSSGGVLVISQFTLLGDARKGRRPSWHGAAPPDKAKELYEYFIAKIREYGLTCESGEFQAAMKVRYTNDGPVTILLDL